MHSDAVTVKYSFRIGSLSREDADSITAKLKNISFTKREQRDGSGMCISIRLQENIAYDFLSGIISEFELSRTGYDIFVSAASESDSEIIGIPDYVEAVAKMTDAPYVFSFTVGHL